MTMWLLPQLAVDIVVPSIGRSSLAATLASLEAAGCGVEQIVVVDDARREGPAAARNRGLAAGSAPWVVFLDDDVVVTPDWFESLQRDLLAAAPDVGAVQGRIIVPLPTHRRLTDWERNTARLEQATWITADLAVRREAIESIGGFDERFHRAYREDSDLALRLMAAGWRLVIGERSSVHPVRVEPWWASLRAQAGNADDALMAALHGPGFRQQLGEPRSMLWRHTLSTAALVLAWLAGRVHLRGLRRWSRLVWLGSTAWFAARRIMPGPKTKREVISMLVSSVLIPPLAVWHRARGELRVRRAGLR